MYYAILSAIHGNMYALEKVIEDMKNYDISKVILLGDIIDYGMQSNEVVDYLRDEFEYEVICNIWGNHERAIMLEDYNFFSSERGVVSAKYTYSQLSQKSRDYLNNELIHEGIMEFDLDGRKCLAVHGSLYDNYWKAILPEDVRGDYNDYDVVFSGHSHYSHVFTKFYDADNPEMRNKHAVVFINPGSVGQPRNHNNNAQYALLDTETMSVNMRSVTYPVDKAMSLYDGSIDEFYKTRLKNGV